MEIPRLLNQKEIVELIFSHLTIAFPENIEFQRELFLIEYWRSLFQTLGSEDENGNVKPVHIRRLRRALHQYLDTIWPELQSDDDDQKSQNQTDVINPVRIILEHIGDIARLHNGYFLPAPLRLVELPESKYSVIIGGLSTETIQLLLSDARIAGYGRIIENHKIPDSIKRDRGWWQEYSNWIGWKPANIENWIKKQISQFPLLGSQSIQGFEEFEVYNISGNMGNRNRSFWLSPNSIVTQEASGTWLCKTTDSRRYFLGEFKDGRLSKELTITNRETLRWLMLGLRAIYGLSPMARWNNNYLKVAPPLPRAIECHVLIFSFKKNTYEYYVPDQFHNHIEQLIISYGYQLPNRRRTTDE